MAYQVLYNFKIYQASTPLRPDKGHTREHRCGTPMHSETLLPYHQKCGRRQPTTRNEIRFRFIGQARSLRDLTVESPVCNYGRWRYDTDWGTSMETLFKPLSQAASIGDTGQPLQRLKRLTLHWNGNQSRYWTIEGNYSKLFAISTLEELTLSCCTFPDEALSAVSDLSKTSLK